VAALIVDSSFTNAVDMGKRIFPFIPSFLVSAKLDSLAKIKNIHVPLLFFHSPEDETVPMQLGQRLFDAAPQPKTFVELEGGHNDGSVLSEEVFSNAISKLLTSI
jgi:fermentation-respiration switch protein FrsA (DUF1100 family)